jgi:hypothetical protein
MEGAFIQALRASRKHSKLQIDNMRCSKGLHKVIRLCKRQWKVQLEELGDPPLQLYLLPTGRLIEDPTVTIEELCRESHVSTEPHAKLNLAYSSKVPFETKTAVVAGPRHPAAAG